MISKELLVGRSKVRLESGDGDTYSQHRFFCRELGELGGQLVPPLGWEEAVEKVLAFAHEVSNAALENACHTAEGFGHGCGWRSFVLPKQNLIWRAVLDLWARRSRQGGGRMRNLDG